MKRFAGLVWIRSMSKWERVILASVMVGIVGSFIPYPNMTEADVGIPRSTRFVKSSELELGDERLSQSGSDGSRHVTYVIQESLFDRLRGKKVAKTESGSYVVTVAQDKIIQQGTRRWQYMICSNGSSRYYSNEQMKDERTGFTSKSEDDCKKNGQGVKVSLSDSPPTRRSAAPSGSYGYVPSLSSLSQNTSSYQGLQYEPLNYDPPTLQQYTNPETPKITVTPVKPPQTAPTCFYYAGNGGCF